MLDNIAFSFIIPCRNGGEYLKECLYSMLSQTYEKFDINVLDNNSTDGSYEWLVDLNNPKIKIIKSDRDLTIEENWSRIMNLSPNEYITISGHDDVFYPTFLEEMAFFISSNPDASLYLSHFNFIDAKSKNIRKCNDMVQDYTFNSFLESILTKKIDIAGTGYVMKFEDYKACGGFNKKYPNLLFADYEIWLRLTQVNKLFVLDKTLFAFRIHNSTTSTSSNQNTMEAFFVFLDFLKSNVLKYEKTIKENFPFFLMKNIQGLISRSLRVEDREISVNKIIYIIENYAIDLNLISRDKIQRNIVFNACKFIDKFNVLRKAYIFIRKSNNNKTILK